MEDISNIETISISKFKALALRLLQKVFDTRQKIVITKKNIPIAMVVPFPEVKVKRKSAFGCFKGKMRAKEGVDLRDPVLLATDWEVLKTV